MEGLYYLIVDQELKGLLEKLAKNHPESSKGVLKLVLKMYLKLVDKSRRKGRDPLITFQNLIETLISGKICETTKEKIEYLDAVLEEKDLRSAIASGSSSYNESSVVNDIREIKVLIQEIRSSSFNSNPKQLLDSFSPKSPSELIELTANSDGSNDSNGNSSEPKKRKNFKDIRKDKQNKIVKF